MDKPNIEKNGLTERTQQMGTKERLIQFMLDCKKKSEGERPEVQWLKEKYARLSHMVGLPGKAHVDALIYERMYGSMPARESDTLKIRYWRTGKHLPVNRDQCILFGQALELSDREMKYLIQNYYDKSDHIFDKERKGTWEESLYNERFRYLRSLIEEYLSKFPPHCLLEMNIAPESVSAYLRHIYFQDALKCVSVCDGLDMLQLSGHSLSVSYESELARSFKLEGEIPRKTMLRHLLLLGMPFISRQILNDGLMTLGYLPLTKGHTMTTGEYLDDLLLFFLSLYEECCRGWEPVECLEWLRSHLRALDGILIEMGTQNLRFMYFKALKEYSG